MNQRIPFYTEYKKDVQFYIKVNSVRGIPIISDKQPSLSFQITEYKQTGKAITTQQHLIKAQEQSLEPLIYGNGIYLNNINKRMNVIIKVFQKNIMFDDIYGYIDIDFYHIPMGVEIIDWFPIVSYDQNTFGCGEANITFGVIIPGQQLAPIVCNCQSNLMKLYYPKSKHVEMILKNEERFGPKLRKERKYEENTDYILYDPILIGNHTQYLRALKGNQ